MTQHVDQERYSMFQCSADEVRKRLIAMVREIEEVLNNKADEVYVAMSRDYRSVLGGNDVPHGEMPPKWQRLMRKDVMAVIEGVEKVFNKVLGLEGGEDEVISEDVTATKEQKSVDAVPETDSAVVKPEPNDESGAHSVYENKDHPIANSIEAARPNAGREVVQEDNAPPPVDSDEEEPASSYPPRAPVVPTSPSPANEAELDREESVSESEVDDHGASDSESELDVSDSDSMPGHSESSSGSDGEM